MPATDILLCTLNARYSHASLGLRYLLANLGDLQPRAAIREFTIHDQPARIVEKLLADSPRIIGFGIYIWNLIETRRVVGILKQVAPEVRIVIGGPEVTHEHVNEPLAALADVLITGEGDLTFKTVCDDLLARRPVAKVVDSPKPDLAQVVLPYHLYSDDDLKHRIIYMEASRGCPFTCEFCLSSIEDGVRQFPLDAFLAAMDDLLARGCRTFKFVDRTFNLSPRISAAILQFFLDRWRDGLFLHFELVPDRLPDALKALIARFPADAVQFEIGIQSFTPQVGELISRRMDRGRTETNFKWLRSASGVHIHADLIIGLPGETPESFAASYDALHLLDPQEIQVGILKLLKGTPLVRHREPFAMRFNPEPPYDLLASRDFDFATMQRLKRFARYHELFVNSGKFKGGIARLISTQSSAFAALSAFADWLWATTTQEHALSQVRQYELFHAYLLTIGVQADEATAILAQDFLVTGSKKYLPEILRPAVEKRPSSTMPSAPGTAGCGSA
jgi:radical SAM superfamily enzyme YgiQ (UPF0313 family)